MTTTKAFPCLEATIEIRRGPRMVRIWIDQDDLWRIEDPVDPTGLEDKLWELLGKPLTAKEIIEELSKLPRINAIQVLRISLNDRARRGIMVYLVPFVTTEEVVDALKDTQRLQPGVAVGQGGRMTATDAE